MPKTIRPTIRPIAPGLGVAEQPQRFLGLEIGARMTVMTTSEGVLIHSPLGQDFSGAESMSTSGVAGVLSPNLLHHLYAGPWLERYPAAGLAPPGLVGKRSDLRFARVVDEPTEIGEVLLIPLKCIPFSEEVVAFHRPSKTLVLTDLVFNLAADAPWATRFGFRMLGAYPGCRCSVLERLFIRREVARRELRTVLELDFDRLIMGHGDIIETNAKAQLAQALSWLL